jgi:hypothetical protein
LRRLKWWLEAVRVVVRSGRISPGGSLGLMQELPFQPYGGLFALSSDVERSALEADRRHGTPAEKLGFVYKRGNANGIASCRRGVKQRATLTRDTSAHDP